MSVLAIKLSIRAKCRIKWCPLKGTQCVKEQKRYRKLGIRYILLGPLISWVTYGHVGLKVMSSPIDKERSHSSHYILRHSRLRLRCLSLQSKSVLCTSRGLSDMIYDIYLTFRHRASYIYDTRTATPQSKLFIYLVNKYISLFFFRLSLTIFVYSSTKCRAFTNITLLGS